MEADVKMIACQMNVDLFGWDRALFVDGTSDWVGAASFLPIAQRSDVNLFVRAGWAGKFQESASMSQERLLTKEKGFPLRLYPPIWFLLFAAAALLVDRLLPLSFELAEVAKPLSLLLALMGGLIALWAALLFRRHNTSAHPYAEASQLVTKGPYRYIRNPMYLGLLLLLIAVGLWLQSLSALLLAPLFVFVINRYNIVPEEERLMQRFGEAYRDYHRRTRRWF